MSPVTEGREPCPHIKQIDSFVVCGRYNRRPKECKDHDFPARFCPIGLEVLGLDDIEKIRQRIDKGYEITKTI